MHIIKQFIGPYRFLSNFYKCVIDYEGLIYPSVEHAYQAVKTLDLITERIRIRDAETPGQAKRRGRTVKLRQEWDDIKVDVMRTLLRLKFSHPNLRQKLLDTGYAYLQEGNYWHDTFWGVDLRTGQGQNMLGKLLMELRSELSNVNWASFIGSP